MNKKSKGCLIFFIMILLIIIIILSWIYYSVSTSHERESNERSECEKTVYISEHPFIVLEKKSKKIENKMSFLLIRNNEIINDTLLKNTSSNNTYYSFNIPFKKIKKTDIVIVCIGDKKYKISGFSYSLKSRWVMFGYNGGECSLDYSQLKINDEMYNFNLLREFENKKTPYLE
ncbi:hypothetical protein [Flavobacterium humidisoli]|uniref:Tissue inhibitor of metalloproteinase n=1 Tax=Flavobacterium humidisoli TaxID=2937442 RepID=A0ABY4LR01_9FLAO|nr:hypothetical protein [Flavobacterium humidisoli]UPZ14281.1 hypothetical protein M0M44_16110 [Flavobacterium humidisoli]